MYDEVDILVQCVASSRSLTDIDLVGPHPRVGFATRRFKIPLHLQGECMLHLCDAAEVRHYRNISSPHMLPQDRT